MVLTPMMSPKITEKMGIEHPMAIEAAQPTTMYFHSGAFILSID